jgi:hypothetical protein
MGTEQELFLRWGPFIFLLYIVLRDGIPLFGRLLEKVVPQRMEQQERAAERKQDLEERHVVALEQIGKSLVLIENKQHQQEQVMSIVTTSLTAANQSLAILLDRSLQRRAQSIAEGITEPLKPIQLSEGANS